MKRIIKKFITLFLPPIVKYILKTGFLILRKPSTLMVTINKFNKKNSVLLVLGNGPSLQGSLAKLERISECGYDCIAVNGFATTESFERVKPNMYLLADPAYFCNREDLANDTKKIVTLLEECLVKKVKWELFLFVPNYGKRTEFINKVQQNSFIKILYYNCYDHFIAFNKMMKFFLWDKNLNALAAQTVLNTCVNLGIIFRYEEIYLVGADTSWHENLRIEQESNRLYTIDKHFYGEKKIYLYADSNEKTSRRLDKELKNISNALSLYWDLKEYADAKRVKVYNASEYSNIDAFPRRSLPC